MSEQKTEQPEAEESRTSGKRRYVKPAIEAEDKVSQYSLKQLCTNAIDCSTGMGFRFT